jgi:pyruvate dehydrogenase E2 component (dihydrolipoamide acetyltransferase)
MAVSVTLPALGESVTEGTVTRWLKQVGETVATDEPLLEISTDKVDTEIPSPAAGVLLEIKVAEDETVEVGTELAVIGEEGEATGDTAAPAAQAEQAPAAEQPEQAPAAEQPEQAPAAEQPEEAPAAEQPEPTPPPEQRPQPAPAAEAESPPGPQPPPQPAQAAPSGDGQGTPVTLPALGESVTEGTVTRWLKQVGDTVAVDEPLLEISTDKVDTEIPSPAAGVLLEIKVAEDETVEVGTELAVIGQQGAAPVEAPSPAAAPAEDQAERPAEEPPAPREEPPLAQEAAQHAAAEAQSAERTQPSAPAAAEQQPASQPAPAAAQAPAGAEPAPAGAAEGNGSPYVTPLVRRLAAEHGVELSSLTGTGVGGRIRKQDVLAAAEAKTAPQRAPAAQPAAPAAAPPAPAVAEKPTAAPPTPSPLRGTTQKLSRRRQTIARRMVESLQVSAQLTTVAEVDLTAVARLRDRAKTEFEQREGVRLSFLPFFAKAALEALKVYPQLNASINSETNEVTYYDVEHLGIAVDTDAGLVVPVIRDAGDLSIAGLARKIADVANRTRTNQIAPDELSGGTFTLTNTGSRGALFDTPILNQPQVGILGTGTVVKRPVVVPDEYGADSIAIRSMCYLALTYDHRLVDGADAARFLNAVKQRLEEGRFESELGLQSS